MHARYIYLLNSKSKEERKGKIYAHFILLLHKRQIYGGLVLTVTGTGNLKICSPESFFSPNSKPDR
jgi:hypothetical protein